VTTTDTSAEAVKRLAAVFDRSAWTHKRTTATTLRALLAERDEARRNARAWQDAAHTAGRYREQERARAERAEAERDEATARGNDWCDQARKLRDERDRLREALEKIAAPVTKLMCAVDAARAARDIARTALKEPGHD
jgi:chromosome segregation ATPase